MGPVKLTDAEIQEEMKTLVGWNLEDGKIVSDYRFQDFAAAMIFANQIAQLAEEVDHHPDILIHGWCNVRLMLHTHSVDGLTIGDFKFAQAVNHVLF